MRRAKNQSVTMGDLPNLSASAQATATTPLLQGGRVEQEKRYGSENESTGEIPSADWVWAHQMKGRKFPQAIAHRGYRAEHPENTMAAFTGAVDVGTHGLETDIHLTSDNVVVLSHDPDLKRCFGIKKKIIDCDWAYISTLRTLRKPSEPMPRLRDLLEYLAKPESADVWLLLDIKPSNKQDDVMRLIAETIASVPSPHRPWSKRIVLGIWVAKFLPICRKYLPEFSISHIGFSTWYARQFLREPNVSFNMLQKMLLGPVGNWFIRDVRKAQRPIFTWTVNAPNLMKWSINKNLDGVITDDPKLFLDVCKNWDDKRDTLATPNWSQWLYTIWLWLVIITFWIPFKWKFPEHVEDHQEKRLREFRMIQMRFKDPDAQPDKAAGDL